MARLSEIERQPSIGMLVAGLSCSEIVRRMKEKEKGKFSLFVSLGGGEHITKNMVDK